MTDSNLIEHWDPEIRNIVCAVRGTPESFKTVNAAIDIASAQEARLTFLLILNAEFLGTSQPVMGSLKTVHRQLTALGEFTMLSLCDEAEQRGVNRVSGVVRLGDFRTELRTFLIESHADVLVVSLLQQDLIDDELPAEDFETYLNQLQEELGVKLQPIDLRDSG